MGVNQWEMFMFVTKLMGLFEGTDQNMAFQTKEMNYHVFESSALTVHLEKKNNLFSNMII